MDDGETAPLLASPRPRSFTNSFIDPVHAVPAAASKLSLGQRLNLNVTQLISFIISTSFLVAIVGWATLASVPQTCSHWIYGREEEKYDWDEHSKCRQEKHLGDVRYYAQEAGFDILEENILTDDGFILRMHQVIRPDLPHERQTGYPVLILHGLFQSSGAFITSEKRSIAFWLAEHRGYQVFLGNTRCVFGAGHATYDYSDPRTWDWTIRDLAMYDLPAMVDWVCQKTGYEKIAFIGHSQGNGLAFISLSQGMRPDIGRKLSCFIALAPVVYAGSLTYGFPFTVLRRVSGGCWKRTFGVLDFIPLMRYSYRWIPARPFAFMGYVMFAYLFSWTDTNWLKRRKIKVFRFTPTPVSSANIFWWCGKGGFAERKCTMDESVPQWFDDRFPPLSLYHGGRDLLVAMEPLIKRLQESEPYVQLRKVTKLDNCEHCDFYLAANAVEWCFDAIVEDIEKTKTHRPGKMLD